MELQTLQWPTRDDHQQTSTAQPTTTKKQPQPPPPATHSPPSSSSSPTHEFSFTISLHPQYNIFDQHNTKYNPSKSDNRNITSGAIHHNRNLKSSSNYPTTSTSTTSSTPPFAIDLSPADDIFFHGHLLPLHLLSHLPISPRSSTNSMDSFTLPIKDDHPDALKPTTSTSFSESRRFSDISEDQMPSSSAINKGGANSTNQQHDGRPTKAKTFSFFRRRKNTEGESDGVCSNVDKYKKNSKLKQEVSQVVKRYVKMVRPFLSFGGGRGGRRASKEFQKQPYSFSGNLSSRSRPDYWSGAGRRGEFSAPASMRTSPTNSGLLIAKSGTVSPTKPPTSDSTMEELQAAIQAAIAHCKNSISTEDKIVQCKD